MARTTIVRRARPDDLTALVDLVEALRPGLGTRPAGGGSGYLTTTGALPDRLAERLAAALSADDHLVLVAEDHGRLVGALAAATASAGPWIDVPTVTVHALLVAEDERRRGVARALLAEVVAHAEEIGAEDVVVSAPPALRDAHRFFARLGFAPVATRRVAPVAGLRRRLGGSSMSADRRILGLRRRRVVAATSGDTGELALVRRPAARM